MAMQFPSSPLDGASGAAISGGRRPAVVAAPDAPSPEILPPPRRRRFTAADKRRILAATDRAAGTGQIGAILRREGLYSSTLTEWRKARDSAANAALAPVKRGPKIVAPNPLAAALAAAQKENARLAKQLARAEVIIDIQKKVADLLGIPPIANDTTP